MSQITFTVTTMATNYSKVLFLQNFPEKYASPNLDIHSLGQLNTFLFPMHAHCVVLKSLSGWKLIATKVTFKTKENSEKEV